MTRAKTETTGQTTRQRSKRTGSPEFRRGCGASRTTGFGLVRSPSEGRPAHPPAPGVRRPDAQRRSPVAQMHWHTALVSLTLLHRALDADGVDLGQRLGDRHGVVWRLFRTGSQCRRHQYQIVEHRLAPSGGRPRKGAALLVHETPRGQLRFPNFQVAFREPWPLGVSNTGTREPQAGGS